MDKLTKQREQLQLLVGENLPVGLEGLVGWDGTERRNALIVVRPQTVSELQKTVRAAVSLRLPVRAVGRECSASGPFYPGEGQVAIYLDQLIRHDGPHIELHLNEGNPLHSELTVMSPVTVDELLYFQLTHGVELLGNVTNRSATVWEIVTTATHGTGLHCKSICDLIVRMRVVDATGELRTYDDTSGAKTLDAVRGGMGLFGVIYDVTFSVTPLSVVQVEDRWVPANQVFYEKKFLAALVHNNVSIEMHWCFMNSVSFLKRGQAVVKKRLERQAWEPRMDEVYVRTVNRPPGPVAPMQEEWFSNRQCPADKVYKARHWISLKVPATMPGTTEQLVSAWKNTFMGTVIQTVPHAINYFAHQPKVPVWDMEFSFDMDEDCANIHYAVMELLGMIREEAAEGRFPVLKMGARFTGASDIYLAPAYAGNAARGGSGNTCHLEIESLPGTAGWHEFACKVAQCWMQIAGARPHWGKQWHFVPGIIQHLQQTCGPELSAFRQVLEEVGQDDTHMFFTPILGELLYGDSNAMTSWTAASGGNEQVVIRQEAIPRPTVTGQQTVPKPQVVQQHQLNLQQHLVRQQQVVQQQPLVQQQKLLSQQPPLVLQEPPMVQVPKGSPVQLCMSASQQRPAPAVLYHPESSLGAKKKNSNKKKWWQRGSGNGADDGMQYAQHQQQSVTGPSQVVQVAAPNQQLVGPKQVVLAPQPGLFPAPAPAKRQLRLRNQQQIPLVKPEPVTLYYLPQGQGVRGQGHGLTAVRQAKVASWVGPRAAAPGRPLQSGVVFSRA